MKPERVRGRRVNWVDFWITTRNTYHSVTGEGELTKCVVVG